MRCAHCPLHLQCPAPVGSNINPDAEVAIILDRPTEEDMRLRRAGSGKLGAELDNGLQLFAKIHRGQTTVTNLVKCRPAVKRKLGHGEMQVCYEKWLVGELASLPKASVVVVFGAEACRFFFGPDFDIERQHGIPISKGGRVWLPAYGPSFEGDILGLFQDDMKALGELYRGEYEPLADPYPEPVYRLHRSGSLRAIAGLEAYLSGSSPLLAIDTETEEGRLWCLSVSSEPGTAVVIEAADTAALSFLDQYARKKITVMHNSLYDLPVLRSAGVNPDKVMDTMVMAYLLGLPQGLKSLAYRLLGMTMQDYSDVCGEKAWELAAGYLWRVMQEQWEKPPPQKVWDSAKKCWRQKKPWGVSQLVQRIFTDMEKGADPVARWENMDEERRIEIEQRLGPMPRGSLKDVSEEKWVWYSGRDADATLRAYHALMPRIRQLGLEHCLEVDTGVIPMCERMMRNGMKVVPGHFLELSAEYGIGIERLEKEMNQVAGEPLLWTSRDQVADLLYGKFGLCPPARTATGKPSVDDDALSKLDHPIIPLIQEHREKTKFKSTYIDVIPRVADSTHRVHTTLKLTRAATGRLTSGDPINLQNQPARGEEAKRYRQGFVCEEGNVLISADYKNIELVVLAHVSQDPTLLRAFREGLDLHTLKASEIFELPESEITSELRSQAKTINFGVVYGATAVTVADAIKVDKDRAQWIIDRWFETSPGVLEYMKRVHQEARRLGYVRDPILGRIRRIPQARSAHGWVQRKALREAGNMPVQGGAQGVIKVAMMRLSEQRVYERHGARELMQIHDSLESECPLESAWEFAEEKKKVMEEVGEVLEMSVPVRVDLKIGVSWDECK